MIDLSAYDTDKSEQYLERYTREFSHLFSAKVKLLELGVQRGGSLYLWRDLFPDGQIAGLDLNPISINDDSGRIHLYQGFQQDHVVLDQIGHEVAPEGFDIVIDDASHLGEYTRDSFWHLFRHHLKPGGIYVIDDWGCAYSNAWADGRRYAGAREAIGDFRSVPEPHAAPMPGPRERIRRKFRSAARPIAAKVPEDLRPLLEKVYMSVDGATIQRRFRSHDYGMAGVVKQLVDAVAQPSIDGSGGGGVNSGIDCLTVYDSQVFVHKAV
jgi:SAM-dependent methyltransferase